jgi:hypothetical protein
LEAWTETADYLTGDSGSPFGSRRPKMHNSADPRSTAGQCYNRTGLRFKGWLL